MPQLNAKCFEPGTTWKLKFSALLPKKMHSMSQCSATSLEDDVIPSCNNKLGIHCLVNSGWNMVMTYVDWSSIPLPMQNGFYLHRIILVGIAKSSLGVNCTDCPQSGTSYLPVL